MDSRGRNADRTDPLRSLREAIARGASQVLQNNLRKRVSQPTEPLEGWRGNGGGADSGSSDDVAAECEWCGGPILERGRLKFCGEKCAKAGAAIVRRASLERRYTRQREGRICAWCGKPLKPATRGHAKYCCIECTQKGYYAGRKATNRRTCVQCGSEFTTASRTAKHCGRSCVAKSRLAETAKRRIRGRWRAHLTPALFDRAFIRLDG